MGVSVCVFIFVCICMYLSVYVCLYICDRMFFMLKCVCILVSSRALKRTQAHTKTNTQSHTATNTHAHTCMKCAKQGAAG